jgi:hypothetical protein
MVHVKLCGKRADNTCAGKHAANKCVGKHAAKKCAGKHAANKCVNFEESVHGGFAEMVCMIERVPMGAQVNYKSTHVSLASPDNPGDHDIAPYRHRAPIAVSSCTVKFRLNLRVRARKLHPTCNQGFRQRI